MSSFRSVRRRAHIWACEPAARARGQDERGSVALEVVLLTPLVVVLLCFVVFCGRVSQAQAIVRDAADAGARAASLRQQPSSAAADGAAAVRAVLARRSTSCPEPSVDVDVTNLRPGGQVSVTVSCRTQLRDLALLGVPGTRTFTARSTEVVDSWRGG